jgi:hypothetical protein
MFVVTNEALAKLGITYASLLSDAYSVSKKRRFSLVYAGIARTGWTGLHK